MSEDAFDEAWIHNDGQEARYMVSWRPKVRISRLHDAKVMQTWLKIAGLCFTNLLLR